MDNIYVFILDIDYIIFIFYDIMMIFLHHLNFIRNEYRFLIVDYFFIFIILLFMYD